MAAAIRSKKPHINTHLQLRDAQQLERGAASCQSPQPLLTAPPRSPPNPCQSKPSHHLSTTATNTSASLRDVCCCVPQRGSLHGLAVLVENVVRCWWNPISMQSSRRKTHSCAGEPSSYGYTVWDQPSIGPLLESTPSRERESDRELSLSLSLVFERKRERASVVIIREFSFFCFDNTT